MATKWSDEKYLYISFDVRWKLQNGEAFERKDFTRIQDAVDFAEGVIAALESVYDIKLADWAHGPSEKGAWIYSHYKGNDEYIKYMRIACANDKIYIKDDSILIAGAYIGAVSLGCDIEFETPGKHGLRIVGDDTIYKQHWITGFSLFATNDNARDSFDLPSLRDGTWIELVPLETHATT